MDSWPVYEEPSPDDSILSERAGEVARQRRVSFTPSKSVRRLFRASMDGLQFGGKQDDDDTCRRSSEDIPEYIPPTLSINMDPAPRSSKGSMEYGYNERDPFLEIADCGKEAMADMEEQMDWNPLSHPSATENAVNTDPETHLLENSGPSGRRPPPLVNLKRPGTRPRNSPSTPIGRTQRVKGPRQMASVNGNDLSSTLSYLHIRTPSVDSSPCPPLQAMRTGSYSPPSSVPSTPAPMTPLPSGFAAGSQRRFTSGHSPTIIQGFNAPSSLPLIGPISNHLISDVMGLDNSLTSDDRETKETSYSVALSAENRRASQKKKFYSLPNSRTLQLTSEAAMSDDANFGDVSDLETLIRSTEIAHSGRQLSTTSSVTPLEPPTQPQGDGSYSRILSSVAPSQTGAISSELPLEFPLKQSQDTTSNGRSGSPLQSSRYPGVIEDDDEPPDWTSSPAKASPLGWPPQSDTLLEVPTELSGQRCFSFPSSPKRSEAKQLRTDYGCSGTQRKFSEKELLEWKENIQWLPTLWKKPSVDCEESRPQLRRRLSLSALITPRYGRIENGSVANQSNYNYRHSCTSIALRKEPKTVSLIFAFSDSLTWKIAQVQHWLHRMDVFDVSFNATRTPQSDLAAAPDRLPNTSASTTSATTLKEFIQSTITSDILLDTEKPADTASANVPGEIETQHSVRPTNNHGSMTGSQALEEPPGTLLENFSGKPSKHGSSRGIVALEGSLHDRKEQESVRHEGMEENILDGPFSRASPFCLDRRITNRSPTAVGCGGFSDIWMAYLGDQPVAIKILRAGLNYDMAKRNRKITKVRDHF